MKVAAAVDFGGTKLMYGLVDATGAVLAQETVPSCRQRAPYCHERMRDTAP